MARYTALPYVHTAQPRNLRLSDLYLRTGEAQADAELRSGLIKAKLFGDIGQTVGQAATNIINAPAEKKRQEDEAAARAQSLQAGKLQLGEAERNVNDRENYDLAMKEGGGARARTLDMLKDRPELQERAAGYFDRQETRVKEMFKDAADEIEQFGYTPEAANTALDHLVENGFDKQKIDQYRAQMTSPDAIKRIVNSIQGKQPVAPPKLEDHDPAKDLVNPITGAVVRSGTPKAPEKPNPTEASLAAAAAAGDQDAIKALGFLRQQHPRTDTNVNDVPPGDWAVTGKDFLSTIPVDWRKTVEKIASYDEDPNKAVASRGGSRERIMKWVNQVNPNYDQSQFALRSPTRKAFTIGTQGQQINAINTAMGHLDQLTDVADQLQQGGFVPGNKAWNSIRTAFGSDKVTNFDTLKDALAGEVAGVLSKGGATVSGIQDAKSHITAANSPQQLAGYVKTLIPVLGSKLASFDYQYKQAMGADDPFSPLSDESKRILMKHGFDPAHPTLGGGPAQTNAAAQFIEAVDPQGNVHHAPAGTPLPAGWKLKK